MGMPIGTTVREDGEFKTLTLQFVKNCFTYFRPHISDSGSVDISVGSVTITISVTLGLYYSFFVHS